MKLRHLVAAAALAAAPCVLPLHAQQQKPQPKMQQERPEVMAHPKVDANDKTYPMEQIATATVHDAWMLSGKNEEAFFDIVEQLAQFSAQKRGLTLPNSEAAGRRMGEMIKTHAKADHDALLYAIVDQAVRTLGTKSTTATTTAPKPPTAH